MIHGPYSVKINVKKLQLQCDSKQPIQANANVTLLHFRKNRMA